MVVCIKYIEQTLAKLLPPLEDCDERHWPSYYRPEALYWLAVVHFAMGSKELSHQKLEAYFSIAHPLDRNIADAKL